MRKLIVLAATLLATANASGQVIFGADVGSPGNPQGALFRAENGAVTAINTGLTNPIFPSLSPDGTLLVVSSPDPAQPNEASTDLFAHELLTGQTRKLVNNVTQPQNDGTFIFSSPLFSGTEVNRQRVAYVNQVSTSNPQGGGSTRILNVIRASDGFDLALAEIGNGNTTDFYQSEFNGISWSPDAPVFATSAYVPVVTNLGRETIAAGIVLFGQGGPGSFVRVGQLTQPVVVDQQFPPNIVVETHAFPAFSRNGSRLAFFRIVFPDPLLTQPVSADLVVIDVTTGNGQIVATFNPGEYPLGVSWSGNDQTLIYSLGLQVNQGGMFPPGADPSTATLFTVSPQGGPVGSVPGAPVGYFPNAIPLPRTVFRSNFEG
ncbi:MAG: hypothetical protein V2J10_08085 [Wenzhouxiangella sp.]|jgi:hypothetical protein|nr:hypothetical protein [Wenzhouxiangella sp.]